MFYVYDLIDPRTGLVFYVGKGTGDRIKAHERAAKKGGLGPKCDTIRAIWLEGLQIERRIVKRFPIEADAYKFEADRILELGLDNLTNIQGGGSRACFDEVKHTRRLLRRFAPILARALKCLHFKPRAVFAGVDIAPAMRALIDTFIEKAGFEAVAAAVLPHGVRLEKQS